MQIYCWLACSAVPVISLHAPTLAPIFLSCSSLTYRSTELLSMPLPLDGQTRLLANMLSRPQSCWQSEQELALCSYIGKPLLHQRSITPRHFLALWGHPGANGTSSTEPLQVWQQCAAHKDKRLSCIASIHITLLLIQLCQHPLQLICSGQERELSSLILGRSNKASGTSWKGK